MIRSTRGQIILILVIYVLSSTFGLYQFYKYDRNKISVVFSELKLEKANLLSKTIEFKSQNLKAYSFDYTYWDEMVNFIESGDVQWAKENIDASASTYEANYVWVYKPDLSIVYSFSEPEIEPVKMLPFDNYTLGKIVSSGKSFHFFIKIHSNIVEISGSSVHPSSDLERVSNPMGYFFAGRLWNEKYLSEIGLFNGSNVEIILPDINGSFVEGVENNRYHILSDFILYDWFKRPLAKVESSYKFVLGESIELSSSRKLLLNTIVYFLIISAFVLFMLFRVFRPLRLISLSLRHSDPDLLRKMLKRKDEFGKLSNIIGDFFKQKDLLIYEIAEKNEIEVLLRKLSQAIEQSPASIVLTDTAGRIEYVNPKFSEVSGYNLSEVIGKNPRFLKSGKKSVSDYINLWNTIKSGKEWRGEFSNKKKNGEIYYESIIVSPIFDEKGSITNYLAVNEDITQKKRSEDIKEVTYNIAQAVTIASDLSDLIDRIHFLMKDLIDVTNYYLALYDKKTDTFYLPHYEDQKDSISFFKADKTLTAYLLRSKKSMLLKEQDIKELKDSGIVKSIGQSAKSWLGVPLYNENDVIGVFVVQSYENENAFTEEDKEMLEFVSHEMSHAIQKIKSDEELKKALEKAELSDKLKSAFLANISHEIRTPLNSILGFTKLVTEEDITIEKKKEFSKMIKNNVDQLLSIINDILDFSLLETGQFRLNKKEFDIDKLIKELRKEYHHCTNERGIELKVSPGHLNIEIFINSDISRVRQILRNLLNNALKFTKSGFIEIGHYLEGKEVVIYVKDSGIGISKEFENQIFQSFTQVEKSKSRKYNGNGLGLALSKRIVEKLDGKIWFESEIGIGSTFYISLPI